MLNKYLPVFILLSILSCAVPCPRDVKEGSIEFSASSKSFLPTAQSLTPITFVNEKGESLVFSAATTQIFDKTQLITEILCERGDFLDKTTQVKYIEAPSSHIWYTTPSGNYTLAIDVVIDGFDSSKTVNDTALVETATVWAQQINKGQNGSINKVTSYRGNKNNINFDSRFNAFDDYRIIADTTILNVKLKNVIVNRNPSESMHLYYEEGNGIVAFTTRDGEVWVKK